MVLRAGYRPRMLNRIGDQDLWEYNAPMRVLGMPLGHRMTVARLPDGKLWLHSPCAHSAALAEELAALGPVGHIVAPNYVHDTYLEQWIPRCPGARFHAPPGFQRVLPAFKATNRLAAEPADAWRGILDQTVLAGMPRVHEVVFLHRPSRTLIVADLAFNLQGAMGWTESLLCRANGCYHRFTPSRMFRAVIADRAAFRSSLDQILSWDFDRIIISHGDNIERGGRQALRAAFAFLH